MLIVLIVLHHFPYKCPRDIIGITVSELLQRTDELKNDELMQEFNQIFLVRY